MRKLILLFCLSLPAFGAIYNGSLSGSPTFGTPAKFNQALISSSDSNYINLPTGVFANLTTGGSWAVEAWLKTTSSSTVVAISSQNDSNNIWFGASGGNFAVSVHGSGGFTGSAMSSGISINDGNYHWCVMVMTLGITLTTYVDGVAGATFTGVFTTPGSDNAGAIGHFTTNGFAWPGSIDEVVIWNTNEYTSAPSVPTAPYFGTEPNMRALYHLDNNALDSHTATITAGPANTFWYFSPYTWHSNGSGTLQTNNILPSSNLAQTNDAGAYFKLAFTGTSAILVVNEQQITGGYPVAKWSVDAGAWQTYTTNGTDVEFTLATGLSSGTHTLLFYLENTYANLDQWNTPTQSFIVEGISLDASQNLVALTNDVAQLPQNILFLGDSIMAGYYVNGYNANSTLTSDGQLSWTYPVAAAFTAEYGNIAFGCQGWSVGGCSSSNVPSMPSSWNLYWSGTSRLISSKLAPIPDYVVVNMGQNDGSTNIQATVVSWITAMRAAVNTNTPIIIVVPFSQNQQSNLAAAVVTAGDPAVYLVNLGTTISYGLNGAVGPSRWAADSGGIHPYGTTDGWLGAMVAQQMQKKTATGSGVSPHAYVQ
jgi:hypothetical protein